ncbi:MAG: winged helix-turn-helix domain-containing protein [Anaeroplasmataceae bacterium]|nr:winged helix-turn-helix domain-containing protein [Anaeroplasmataceae bacterium]
MRAYKEMEIKLLKLISECPSITIDEMCERLYLGRTTVMQYLRKFKEENLLYDNGEKRPFYRRLLTKEARLLLTKI